ncbi:MAG: aminopeptidase P family N-terminal domain-containing protein [Deltaproteobacteria bacterium]
MSDTMSLRAFNPGNRIEDLQKQMIDVGIDVVLLTYSRSVLYYAGTVHPSILVVTSDDTYLFVMSGLESAAEETWIEPDHVSQGTGYEDWSSISSRRLSISG